ncbi:MULTISPECIES: triose-phosphate isomerase [Parachlamydia]|uniref:Triosephosphate isomerase n=2 Tax=Parachlamydia acanthamoebae TaxID=83552 RepID=F8KYE1_PARAV|nr:triose-phosphate isomerase [Parachlamydia acanthamoebae]KIA78381.1 Triosephosphate isomerase [Parachlamydia acanthamoebae]CCB85879.1 triosephosphate isomerase [Parachlamydia acanthamoebae UV-7]
MADSKRAPVIVGNWKMHKTIQESVDFIKQLGLSLTKDDPRVCLAVPYTAIYPSVEAARPFGIVIGAQNMNDAAPGAFTGEIAGVMLKEAGAQFVILGHSERRELFNETDQIVNQKVHRAFKDQLDVILCVGETLEEREAGKTEEKIRGQIEASLDKVTQEQFLHLMIAYEPIWAIGTNQVATPDEAEKVHVFVRELITARWGEEVAGRTQILYGGSVKPENASDLMSQANIDGLLVGGASLSPASFRKIIEYQNFNSGVSS